MLGIAQTGGGLQRGNDGKVVADLAVVKHALGRLDVVVGHRLLRKRGQVCHAAVGQHGHGFMHHGHVVFGQGAGIGARIGQGLVALVQALGQRQSGFGTEAEAAIGLALQRGQVKQQGAGLRRGFAFFRHCGGLAPGGAGDVLGFEGGPDAVGALFGVGQAIGAGWRPLELWIKPFAGVGTGFSLKVAVDFPVVAADELADFFFALHHHRQGRGLHPAHGGQKEAAIAGVERRHGTGTVDANQPIGLGAGTCCIGQTLHLRF